MTQFYSYIQETVETLKQLCELIVIKGMFVSVV